MNTNTTANRRPTKTADLPLFASAIAPGAAAAALQRGMVAADTCLENSRMESADWPERAWQALIAYVNLHRNGNAWTGEAAVEFVCRQPGVGQPHDTRAAGALFARLKRQGLASQTDEFYRREHGNGTFARKWVTL